MDGLGTGICGFASQKPASVHRYTILPPKKMMNIQGAYYGAFKDFRE